MNLTRSKIAIFTVAALAIWANRNVSNAADPEYRVEKTDDGLDIFLGDQPITKYWKKSGRKPILWPIWGPGGQEMTRAYPMLDGREGEAHDHIHHRSFWFTHGEVNDVDFWAEPEKGGTIEHKDYVEMSGGSTAKFVTNNDWVGPDGKRILQDVRHYEFAHDDAVRWIDFTVKLTASDGPVHFGDTKEGSFGVRVAATMKVDAKLGGTIVSNEGVKNEKAWGQEAAWVDYFGPVGDSTVGIAIMTHPSSFNYPDRWHVRTYGLFAANPFGEHHFTGSKEAGGGYTLPAGESIQMKYRVVLHSGDEVEGKIADRWAEFAK